MKHTPLLLVVITSYCVSLISSSRILALFPYIGKSHFDVYEPYVRELAARGHQVVVLSHFPQKHPVANYTDISLVGSITVDSVDRMELDSMSGIAMLKTAVKEVTLLWETCDKMLSFNKVQELLKSEETFDLVITETFATDCFLPFVHKFNAPHVAISSCVLFPWSNDRMGNPDNPSFIPVQGTSFSDQMSFSERLRNFLANVAFNTVFNVAERIVTEGYVSKHIGNGVPPLSDIARNTSLLLVNTHFSLNRPRPLVPGVVEVGGLHLKPPKKLPKVQLICCSSGHVTNTDQLLCH